MTRGVGRVLVVVVVVAVVVTVFAFLVYKKEKYQLTVFIKLFLIIKFCY